MKDGIEPTTTTQSVRGVTANQTNNGAELSMLGSQPQDHILPGQAQDRALGVLADPLALKQAGSAAPLLAVVNERCGNGVSCRLRYADIARELDVSVTTIKTWADLLEKLGYFTRQPCGPAGVDIRLSSERWPSRSRFNAVNAMAQRAVAVLDAVRVTVDAALVSAAADVRRAGGVTV
jgi:hypothetical protein